MSTIGQMTKLSDLIPTEYDLREFKRGEIYYVDLEDIGYASKNVMTKTRPALIIQNNIGNAHSQTVIIALLTTSYKKDYPFQYQFKLNNRDSIIMFNQIMTVDKYRLLEKCGGLTDQQMKAAEKKLMYSLQLNRLSFENLIDFNVVSVVNKKTKSQETTYFEIELFFEHNLSQLSQIALGNLQKFNPIITKNTSFDDLKRMLDCCKGLHWLTKHNEI